VNAWRLSFFTLKYQKIKDLCPQWADNELIIPILREKNMNHHPLKPMSVILLACLANTSWALEQAKVISSTPVVQQVSIPQRVCNNVPVAVQEPKTGAGALMGAIAGGVIGNAMGQGAGNAAATALGVMGGAVIGDHLEGGATSMGMAQQCSTQYTLTSQVTHYNVVYEFAGKQYSVQMAKDPGASLSVETTPTPVGLPPVNASMVNAGVPPGPIEGVNTTPWVAPTTQYVQAPTTVYTAPPVYVNPYPYGAYYAPIYNPYPVSVGIGFGFGGYRGGRGHWR
jgi:uncharacterized protein YcfJ